MNTSDIWKKVLAVLETEISKANFLTLFKNTALLSLEDDIATIAAPSPMIIDLIQKRFNTLIKSTLDKILEKDISVLYVTKSIQKPETTTDTDSPLFSQTSTPQKAIVGHLPRVRPDYTFQTLAVSSSNQIAFISATTVSNNLGKMYNPLFIYGPVGVGKTHLMQAIANDVYSKNSTNKIIYITSEEFTNEVVDAIRSNQTHTLKKKFRNIALLIIDDVQFIAGKDKVQEELFHTFNILIDNGAQIVLSSDRPPSEIKKLEKRLSSRFSGGLTVDIEPPDFELKTAILLIKVKKFGIDMPIEAAKIIAQSVEDTRSLEGALLRIITVSTTRQIPVTPELAQQVLFGTQKVEGGIRLHAEDIVKQVCNFYQVKPTQLKGPKRDASLVKARQITMYLLKKELDLPYVEIGNLLGGRDHTTIMHGFDKIAQLVDNKARVSEEIVGITKLLRE